MHCLPSIFVLPFSRFPCLLSIISHSRYVLFRLPHLPETLSASLVLVPCPSSTFCLASAGHSLSVYQMDNDNSTVDENNFSWSYSQYSDQCCWEQTPFAEFAWSVQQLCKALWPSSFEEISLESLNGGSFNRIIGLSLKSSLDTISGRELSSSDLEDLTPPNLTAGISDVLSNTPNQVEKNDYVLRIPRSPDKPIDGDLVTLWYIRTKSSIPVPYVIAFDLGADNALDSPYTIQRRIPGICLLSVLWDLTQPQRRQLTVQLANIMRELTGISSPVPGQLGFPKVTVSPESCIKNRMVIHGHHHETGEETLQEKLSRMMAGTGFTDSDTGPQILHYDSTLNENSFNGAINSFDQRKGNVILACIQFQLTRHMIDALTWSTGQVFKTKQYTRLLEMAREMHDHGFLDDDHCNLFHNDLEARNIMVQIDDAGDLKITGILDWDQAKFVPRFVSCCPLPWLWCYDDDPYLDEATAYETPEDSEMHELKQLFDEHVGEDFVKFAYPPEYRLARRLFRFAVEGFYKSEDGQGIDDLISDWTEFRDELGDSDAESMNQTEKDESDLPDEQELTCVEPTDQEADTADVILGGDLKTDTEAAS